MLTFNLEARDRGVDEGGRRLGRGFSTGPPGQSATSMSTAPMPSTPARPLSITDQEDAADAGTFDYVVSITGRSRRRCLHAAGGCYRARTMSFVQHEVYAGRVEPSLYTAVCRVCWKGAAAEMLAPQATQEGTDTSSSSSSDSA